MSDMSQVIIPKSDQWNADDFLTGSRTFTIKDVQIRGGQEQPVSIFIEGSDKVFRPCKSMSRVLVYCWGPDAKQYIGRSLTLYRDPNVKWGGMAVGGIRISHASHIEKAQTMVLAESKASRKPYTVKPLVLERAAPKADKVADGVRDLLARIAAGEDVAHDPAVQKQRAWLADKRPELAAQIDAALAARDGDDDPFGLPPISEGPAEEQRGEAHAGVADAIIAEINQRGSVPDVNSYVASQKDVIAGLDTDDRERIAIAQDRRAAEIKGATS